MVNNLSLKRFFFLLSTLNSSLPAFTIWLLSHRKSFSRISRFSGLIMISISAVVGEQAHRSMRWLEVSAPLEAAGEFSSNLFVDSQNKRKAPNVCVRVWGSCRARICMDYQRNVITELSLEILQKKRMMIRRWQGLNRAAKDEVKIV